MPACHLADLDPHARDLAEQSVAWMDQFWDKEAALLRMPLEKVRDGMPPITTFHPVRETAWYATGLLLRAAPGDGERACRALAAVLTHQFDEPDAVYHGTFARAPEEPHPRVGIGPEPPREWRDYDPNWREFIGTTLILVLQEYEADLPAELVQGIDRALRLAVEGTLARRVAAAYTNISLMCAFLLDYAAGRLGEPAWAAQGAALAQEIHRLFRAHDAFNEYNSPTYYGVDLNALALWRGRAPSPLLRDLGADMEARFWRDIARYYHAGLRNMAGPYDRAYGMDMRRYAAVLGLWIWLVTGREQAPFPDITRPFDHFHDFCFGPLPALLGAAVPDDARPHFLAFRGERDVEQTIEPANGRVATAWLGERAMFGAETALSRTRSWSQFHPATLHWQAAPGAIGWMRLLWRQEGALDARAAQGSLTITCDLGASDDQTLLFEVYAPGATPAAFQSGRWDLPGLPLTVEANAAGPEVTADDDHYLVRYTARRTEQSAPVKIVLRV
ncbi:MAG: hypothetical protein ACTHMJ_11235 [Thermomicrobiales bacterium]